MLLQRMAGVWCGLVEYKAVLDKENKDFYKPIERLKKVHRTKKWQQFCLDGRNVICYIYK